MNGIALANSYKLKCYVARLESARLDATEALGAAPGNINAYVRGGRGHAGEGCEAGDGLGGITTLVR